jgi:hypothetical protein
VVAVVVTWEAGCILLEGFGERVDGEIGLWTLGSAASIRHGGKAEEKCKRLRVKRV